MIANNSYDAASLRGLGCRERFDEGLLQVTVIEVQRRLDFAGIAASVVLEDAAQDDRVEQWTAASIKVESLTEELTVGIDGEAATITSPALLSSHPSALRLRSPRDQSERSQT